MEKVHLHSIDTEKTTKALVVKHNNLIEARYQSFSIAEQRVILMLLAQIHSDDKDFKCYRITVADFSKVTGIPLNGSFYENLKDTLTKLTQKSIHIQRSHGGFLVTNWLSSGEYIHGEGCVELCFDPKLKPYLLDLKSHFTKYNLDIAIKFRSQYSIRLYEVLKKEAQTKERYKHRKKFDKVCSYDELRIIFAIEDDEYKVFNNFKQKVLEPAIKEISDKTDLNIVETTYIKTGRKITSVCFSVVNRGKTETQLRQDNLRIDDIEPELPKEEDHPIIQALMGHGFTWENARTFKNKYGSKKIERNLAYMKAERANGKKITSEASYIVKAVQEDWGLALEQEKEKQAETRKRIEKEAREKKEQEDREKEIIAEKHKQALDVYNKSPDFIKKMILDSFNTEVLQENKILLDGWKTAQKIGTDEFLNSPLLRSTFTTFLVNKNFQ